MNELREYFPDAKDEDWELKIAGQRVQVIKRDPQMESIMRARLRELGIERGSRLEKVIEEKNLERALAISVKRERDIGWER